MIEYIEYIGVITGLLYLYYEIKQRCIMYLMGALCGISYIVVLFDAHLYAVMLYNIYFALISFYGWWLWRKKGWGIGSKPIIYKRLSMLPLIGTTIVTGIFTAIIGQGLILYTDAAAPWADAFVTACSIVATALVTFRYINSWAWWGITNLFSIFFFITQGLYPTAGLYVVYSVLTAVGYWNWQKNGLLER